MNELVHISAFYSLILFRSERLSRVETALQDLAREQNKPLPPGTILRLALLLCRGLYTMYKKNMLVKYNIILYVSLL